MPRIVYPDLIDVLAELESRNKQFLIRFSYEDLRFYRGRLGLSDLVFYNGCSLSTAEILASSKFGLFQFGGVELYRPELGLDCEIGRFLGDRDRQISIMRTYLDVRECYGNTELLYKSRGARMDFIRIYDRGEIAQSKIMDAIKKLTVIIPDC